MKKNYKKKIKKNQKKLPILIAYCIRIKLNKQEAHAKRWLLVTIVTPVS
jgi:hypothetical protein